MKLIYPGYDVLSKRHSQSWDEPTRQVIDARLAIGGAPRFLNEAQWQTLDAVCQRILPQPIDRPRVPLAALVDNKLLNDRGDGYRDARLPPLRQAWQLGLTALDAEAQALDGRGFTGLTGDHQDALLSAMQRNELKHSAWKSMPCVVFFSHRLIHDITSAYYAHPTAWSEIGFGGPANPRGYVRMGPDSRDPWEPMAAKPGAQRKAEKRNRHVG